MPTWRSPLGPQYAEWIPFRSGVEVRFTLCTISSLSCTLFDYHSESRTTLGEISPISRPLWLHNQQVRPPLSSPRQPVLRRKLYFVTLEVLVCCCVSFFSSCSGLSARLIQFVSAGVLANLQQLPGTNSTALCARAASKPASCTCIDDRCKTVMRW